MKPMDSPHTCTILNAIKCLFFLMETRCLLFQLSSEFLCVICMSDAAESFNEQEMFIIMRNLFWGTAVAKWLRCCDTNRNVAGSIPDGVIGIFY